MRKGRFDVLVSLQKNKIHVVDVYKRITPRNKHDKHAYLPKNSGKLLKSLETSRLAGSGHVSNVSDVGSDVRRRESDAACREKGRAFRGLFLFISLFHVHLTTTMVDN